MGWQSAIMNSTGISARAVARLHTARPAFDMRRARTRLIMVLASAGLLAGCAAVGPDYTAPAPKLASTWQAATPHGGSTTQLLGWWQAFQDPLLDTLLAAAEADNPTLGQATAAIASARASRDQAAAKALPSVNASASATRSGSWRNSAGSDSQAALLGQAGSASVRSTGLDASWEIDLFGAVRRSREAADARLQARQADWHEARVSLAAETASEYVSLRGCQLTVASQQSNLDSLRKTAASIRVAVDSGLTAPADAALSTASAASAAATLNAQQAECDVGIKALVALTGLEEPALRQELAASPARIPEPAALDVTVLPVALLSQRPDLVASERSLAAASAEIGVAEANRYPRLSLLGNIAVGRTETAGFGIPTSPWSFGPSLSLPLFDGGALRAQAAGARAAYDAALAGYQASVRAAVKETEQSLVRLDAATRRTDDVAASAENYRRYFNAAQENWRAGGISLLTLEEARRNAIAAEQNLITVRRDRVLYGVALYKALGGGWRSDGQTDVPPAKESVNKSSNMSATQSATQSATHSATESASGSATGAATAARKPANPAAGSTANVLQAATATEAGTTARPAARQDAAKNGVSP